MKELIICIALFGFGLYGLYEIHNLFHLIRDRKINKIIHKYANKWDGKNGTKKDI